MTDGPGLTTGEQPAAHSAGSPVLPPDPLAPFLAGRVGRRVEDQAPDERDVALLLAYRRLQDVADYRLVLQRWFGSVAVGGHLVVTVPHAFLHGRQLALPSPWRRAQRRLYTPASLLQEVEEALVPNSYRVRWLGDLDRGYDYGLPPEIEPVGDADLALVVERIAPPDWPIVREPEASTDGALQPFAFEPVRTRVELAMRSDVRRVLILKLDHLGDLIMGLPALERARGTFADAEITLVVGSWNAAMARDLGVADKVVAFDAFPRNSSEEEANVAATIGLFRALITEEYDLAIDLRADVDTRQLLRTVKAPLKAGIGTRSRFPFLDIALPIDATRNDAARATEQRLFPDRFIAQGSTKRGHFGISSDKDSVERDCAIVWGPLIELNPGDYLFDFYINLDRDRGGLIKLDIALDRGKIVAEMIVSGPAKYHLAFRIEKPRTLFEARIWALDEHPSLDFDFYGGLLVRKGPDDVLHQSEYLLLLIELVRIRLQEHGALRDVTAP